MPARRVLGVRGFRPLLAGGAANATGGWVLVTANAFLGGAQDLAIIVGPVAAAALNSRWGLTGAFVFDAATFLVAALVAMRLFVPPLAGHTERESPAREVRAGFALVRRTDG